MNKSGILYTVIFTFLVCFFFVLLLSIVHAGTIQRIEENQKLFTRRSILSAFGIEYQSLQEAEEQFQEKIETEYVNGETVYNAVIDGETAYAHIFTGQGLWGTINGVLAVNSDLSRIIGMEIISHNETPGLGGRIDEEWYKKQFRGEAIPDNTIAVDTTTSGEGDYQSDNSKVDGISGATRTSQYLEIILNNELDTLQALVKEME